MILPGIKYYTFKDKRARNEFTQGGEVNYYKPEGLIISINYLMPKAEKIDLLVFYISPRGYLYKETRGIGDVEITEVKAAEWLMKHSMMERQIEQKPAGRLA